MAFAFALDVGGWGPKFVSARSRMVASRILRRSIDPYPRERKILRAAQRALAPCARDHVGTADMCCRQAQSAQAEQGAEDG
jgi:hypothetical protein